MRGQKSDAKLQKSEVRLGVALALLLVWAASAQAVQVWVPDSMSGNVGDTVRVPILVSGQVGQGVIAADITLNFGEAVLTATGDYITGNAAQGWMVYTNPMPCSLLIAMASASPLVAGDTLLIVKMLVDSADTTTVWFSRCRLNEGQVPCTTRSGKFYGFPTGVEQPGSMVLSSQFSVWPNLVTRSAWVRLVAGNRGRVRISVRDVAGNPVRVLYDGVADAAGQRLYWNCDDHRGRRVPAGVYFCTLVAGEQRISRKVVLTE
jgi:hypothetical protein